MLRWPMGRKISSIMWCRTCSSTKRSGVSSPFPWVPTLSSSSNAQEGSTRAFGSKYHAGYLLQVGNTSQSTTSALSSSSPLQKRGSHRIDEGRLPSQRETKSRQFKTMERSQTPRNSILPRVLPHSRKNNCHRSRSQVHLSLFKIKTSMPLNWIFSPIQKPKINNTMLPTKVKKMKTRKRRAMTGWRRTSKWRMSTAMPPSISQGFLRRITLASQKLLPPGKQPSTISRWQTSCRKIYATKSRTIPAFMIPRRKRMSRCRTSTFVMPPGRRLHPRNRPSNE